jgi:Fur family transcriptional regulator, ferric uptake regulator
MVLGETTRPLAAAEVLAAARRQQPRLGLATVYRALRDLGAAGEITEVGVPGEPPRYERAGLKHHHHFHCDACGRVFDLEGCAAGIRALVPAGYEPRAHELTFFGLCPECVRRR